MPLKITLHKALLNYRERTNIDMTYEELAKKTGLSKATIESIASRPKYNATIDSLSKICEVLDVEVCSLIERYSENCEVE